VKSHDDSDSDSGNDGDDNGECLGRYVFCVLREIVGLCQKVSCNEVGHQCDMAAPPHMVCKDIHGKELPGMLPFRYVVVGFDDRGSSAFDDGMELEYARLNDSLLLYVQMAF
jgi:hypothetical protein